MLENEGRSLGIFKLTSKICSGVLWGGGGQTTTPMVVHVVVRPVVIYTVFRAGHCWTRGHKKRERGHLHPRPM